MHPEHDPASPHVPRPLTPQEVAAVGLFYLHVPSPLTAWRAPGTTCDTRPLGAPAAHTPRRGHSAALAMLTGLYLLARDHGRSPSADGAGRLTVEADPAYIADVCGGVSVRRLRDALKGPTGVLLPFVRGFGRYNILPQWDGDSGARWSIALSRPADLGTGQWCRIYAWWLYDEVLLHLRNGTVIKRRRRRALTRTTAGQWVDRGPWSADDPAILGMYLAADVEQRARFQSTHAAAFIAQRWGLSKRSVAYAFDAAEQWGVIAVVGRGGGHGRRATRTLAQTPDAALGESLSPRRPSGRKVQVPPLGSA